MGIVQLNREVKRLGGVAMTETQVQEVCLTFYCYELLLGYGGAIRPALASLCAVGACNSQQYGLVSAQAG